MSYSPVETQLSLKNLNKKTLSNDNWISIGQYDNCLALNDLKQEIVGIKDKADNRHVRVRAPSQLIFVAQAAELNRTPENRTL